MKIEILKENLKNGLSVVDGVVGKNISLPILNNVLIQTQGGFLNLISTDLETAVRLWVLTKIVKEGRVVVPAKFLSSFVSSLPNEKILLEAKDQRVHVECKSIKTQIQGQNPEDFPLIPEFSNAEHLEVDVQGFCQGLSQAIDIPVASQARPEISGIYFHFSKNTITIASTDSFRLAEKKITLEKPVKKDYTFILPARPAREVITILGGKEGVVNVYFSDNQVMFEVAMKEAAHPEIQIVSRLIDGEYPSYQDIIPTSFKTRVVIKKDELLNQIKTASLFSGKVNEIKISTHPEKGWVALSAKSVDVGEHESQVTAKIEGASLEISFNYKYLVEGLMNIKSSEVMFDISKEEGPCVLRPVGDASYLYVVMPIKSI